MFRFRNLDLVLIDLFVMILLALSLAGCGGGSSAGTSGGEKTVSNIDNRGNKGDITTGASVEAVSQTVTAAGGTITYSKSGDPLDGLQIVVPQNALSSSREFKISYAPIEKSTFGADFNPITPLITVDNGGGLADICMT